MRLANKIVKSWLLASETRGSSVTAWIGFSTRRVFRCVHILHYMLQPLIRIRYLNIQDFLKWKMTLFCAHTTHLIVKKHTHTSTCLPIQNWVLEWVYRAYTPCGTNRVLGTGRGIWLFTISAISPPNKSRANAEHNLNFKHQHPFASISPYPLELSQFPHIYIHICIYTDTYPCQRCLLL